MSGLTSKIPLQEHCCFFFELEIGCLIIGWVGMVLNLVSLIVTGVAVVSNPQVAGQLVINIIYVLVSLSLLYGIYKKRPSFVFLWVVVNIILCVILLIDIIILIVYLNVAGVVLAIIIFLIYLYFGLVVYSYYVGVSGQQ